MSSQSENKLCVGTQSVNPTPAPNCNTPTNLQPITFDKQSVKANPAVRQADFDPKTGLELYCYTSADNSTDEFTRHCRGLVFDGDKLVLKAFPCALEHTFESLKELENDTCDFKSWAVYSAYEGALLRLFHYGGKWHLSTHRKLDAFKSKWSSKDSFGTLFKRALEKEVVLSNEFNDRITESTGDTILERFQNTLDKSKAYLFLLKNNSENRIVCHAPSPSESSVVYLGIFQVCPEPGLVPFTPALQEDCNLPLPTRHVFESLLDLLTYVDQSVDILREQGVVCIHPSGEHVKILNMTYANLLEVRGNEASVPFRYLQLRNNEAMVKKIYDLYPDMTEIFEEYENVLSQISDNIWSAYQRRFIRRETVFVDQDEFGIMRNCHSWHVEDRQNNRVCIEKVHAVLGEQKPTVLNRLIKKIRFGTRVELDEFPPGLARVSEAGLKRSEEKGLNVSKPENTEVNQSQPRQRPEQKQTGRPQQSRPERVQRDQNRPERDNTQTQRPRLMRRSQEPPVVPSSEDFPELAVSRKPLLSQVKGHWAKGPVKTETEQE